MRITTKNNKSVSSQVPIEIDGQTLTHQVQSGTGQVNQNDFTLHFGLAANCGPVNIHINWPNGTGQTVSDVSVNQTITIYGPELKADMDLNFIVNNADLSALVSAWLQSGPIPQDLNGDGKVTMDDYAILAGEFLKTLPCLENQN